ncbi:MAG: hypothetical protein P1R58_07865 [bacterium]|nr:hypothetical protein [bacterium]
MIIKSFAAASSAAALKLVREEMGGDAIVLKTTRVSDRINGNQVEITACLEKPSVDQSSRLLSDPVDSNKAAVATAEVAEEAANIGAEATNRTEKINEIHEIEKIRTRLFQADLSSEFISGFLYELAVNSPETGPNLEQVQSMLSSRLAEVMLPGLNFVAGDRVLFVGPAGSGKSSAMAKMAAHLVTRSRLKVRLSTLDDVKVGALEEIQNYADFLDLEMTDPVYQSVDDCVTLIDAPSQNFGDASAEALQGKIIASKPNYCFLVISALMRSSDIIRYVAQAAELNSATHLIVTMLDQTDALGGIVAATSTSDLQVAFITDAPGGMGMITTPDPYRTAGKILGIKDSREQA